MEIFKIILFEGRQGAIYLTPGDIRPTLHFLRSHCQPLIFFFPPYHVTPTRYTQLQFSFITKFHKHFPFGEGKKFTAHQQCSGLAWDFMLRDHFLFLRGVYGVQGLYLNQLCARQAPYPWDYLFGPSGFATINSLF